MISIGQANAVLLFASLPRSAVSRFVRARLRLKIKRSLASPTTSRISSQISLGAAVEAVMRAKKQLAKAMTTGKASPQIIRKCSNTASWSKRRIPIKCAAQGLLKTSRPKRIVQRLVRYWKVNKKRRKESMCSIQIRIWTMLWIAAQTSKSLLVDWMFQSCLVMSMESPTWS